MNTAAGFVDASGTVTVHCSHALSFESHKRNTLLPLAGKFGFETGVRPAASNLGGSFYMMFRFGFVIVGNAFHKRSYE